jgi:isopenicillin-N N-acyltransferase like protein
VGFSPGLHTSISGLPAGFTVLKTALSDQTTFLADRIQSNLMARFYRIHCSALFLLGWFCCMPAGCAESPESLRPIQLARAPVPEPFPIPVVVLDGTSAQLGTEHGEQKSAAIHQLLDHYLLAFVGTGTKRFLAYSAASIFENQLRPEHRTELHALAQQIQVDERETMLGQCFLDLAQLSACSTITLPASAAPDHVARFGRNLDFWSLNIADKYTTVFVVRPNDGRYAYAAVGWPGMIGVLSGMNEDGLCLANMEVPRTPRFPVAMPYTLLYRTVLERCATVQQAVDLLQKTPRQSANNLMLMDAAGDRAVVELSPEAVRVRWGARDTPLISTNHQRDQDADSPGRCVRYDYLHDTSRLEYGQIDQPVLEKMLAHVGSHGTLQAMIFEPSNRVIYLAAGAFAANRHFYRLDLTPYFAAARATVAYVH